MDVVLAELPAAERIANQADGIGIVAISDEVDVGLAIKLLANECSGRGYLLKSSLADLDLLEEATDAVKAGRCFVDPAIVGTLMGNGGGTRLSKLTQRERDILGLMAEGRSNSAICDRLVLSPRTVETHVRNIFGKLELTPAGDDHRRVLAVLRYLGR